MHRPMIKLSLLYGLCMGLLESFYRIFSSFSFFPGFFFQQLYILYSTLKQQQMIDNIPIRQIKLRLDYNKEPVSFDCNSIGGYNKSNTYIESFVSNVVAGGYDRESSEE